MCLLIGYFLVYFIVIIRLFWCNVLLMLVIIFFWINFLVCIYVWIVLFWIEGIFNIVL